MRESLRIGCSLLLAAIAASVASAQSPRADISWMAGGHIPPVASVAYSPDGTVLASSGYFGDTIKLWRTSDGGMVRTFSNTSASSFIFGPMVPVTFFPDGRTIMAYGEGAGPGFWNVADGRLLRELNIGGNDLALNPDGTLIAVAVSSIIRLVRVSDGVVVRTIAWPSDFVQRVAFSLNGTVVAGGDRVGTLRTFRVADGAPLLSIQAHSDYINALRYSPNGTRIATGSSDHTVKLWDSTSGKLVGTLNGHTNAVTAIAFSPDGALLASSSTDSTVKLWSMPSGTLSGTLSEPDGGGSISFNTNSTRLAVASSNELREWDVPSQTVFRNLLRASNGISGTIFTRDGTKLVSASSGKISISDAETGALLRQIDPGGVSVIAVSTDMIAAGVNPSNINLYRLSDGALLRTLVPGGQAYLRSVVFSPDGATLATGHFGNAVRVWNVSDGTLLRTLGPGGSGDMNGVAYTSDGSLLVAASSDRIVRVWDTQGNLLRTMGPVGQALSSVAISPDNRLVLAGGRNDFQDGLLQVWRLDTGATVYSFASSGGVTQVRFTSSGFAFYAARTAGTGITSTGTVQIYRTSDHAVLETYSLETGGFGNNPSGSLALDVSPDGKHVSYGRDDATVVMAYNTLIAAPTSATPFMGQIISGTFQDLVIADGAALVARPGFNGDRQSAPVQLDITAHIPLPNPLQLSFQMVASANLNGLQQEIWMRNVQNGTFELVDTRPAPTTDQTLRIVLGPNIIRYIDASGNILARVKWALTSQNVSRTWLISVDQAIWATGL